MPQPKSFQDALQVEYPTEVGKMAVIDYDLDPMSVVLTVTDVRTFFRNKFGKLRAQIKLTPESHQLLVGARTKFVTKLPWLVKNYANNLQLPEIPTELWIGPPQAAKGSKEHFCNLDGGVVDVETVDAATMRDVLRVKLRMSVWMRKEEEGYACGFFYQLQDLLTN